MAPRVTRLRQASVALDRPILSLRDVEKHYRMGEVVVKALRGVTFDVARASFVAIVGQSGSGKSTLMHLLGCLDVPTKGTVELDGQDIGTLAESDLASLRGRKIGFIFQQYHLIPTLSALENVLLPLEFQEVPDHEAIERAKRALEMVGLGDRMLSLPTQLSGGQQQRVSIARCLVVEPEIILADEPTGALDTGTGELILDILERLWRNESKTVVVVTHDPDLASKAARIITLSDGLVTDDVLTHASPSRTVSKRRS